MLTYLYGADQLVAGFVAQMIPHCRRGFPLDATAIGVMRDGALIGGMVYHNYDAEAGLIEMSGAAVDARWLTRETLARVYRYPFIQCGVQMTLMRVPIENERLLRQLAAFNYTFVKVPRMFGRDKDGVLCLLTYEDWCENKVNKRYRHHETDAELEDAA
jgi:hypothetical protein